MKELHEAARDVYLLWKHTGKPRHGVVYDIMKQSRSRFKHGLRVCKIIFFISLLIKSLTGCVKRMTELSGEK